MPSVFVDVREARTERFPRKGLYAPSPGALRRAAAKVRRGPSPTQAAHRSSRPPAARSPLTAVESGLLRALALAAGRVVTTEALLREVWGAGARTTPIASAPW